MRVWTCLPGASPRPPRSRSRASTWRKGSRPTLIVATHRTRLTAAALFLVAAAAAGVSRRVAAQRPPLSGAPADLIVINGAVYAADRGDLRQALAIRGNRIAVVGTMEEIERLRGPRTEIVEAHGGAVVPGFNDIHTH